MIKNHQSINRSYGFTLIEMMVAVAIFAMIGTATYSVLHNLIEIKLKGDLYADRSLALQNTYWIMQTDFEQVVYRPIRDENDDTRDAIMTGYFPYKVELTRQGYRNPLDFRRSNQQRVAYGLVMGHELLDTYPELDEETQYLVRYSWHVLDRGDISDPYIQALIDGVNEMDLQFQDREGEWHDSWPQSVEEEEQNWKTDIPISVVIALNTNRLDDLEFRFLISHVDEEKD